MDHLTFDPRWTQHVANLGTAHMPVGITNPRLIAIAQETAAMLGLCPSSLSTPRALAMLAGNSVPQGAHPIATVYAGHQFGVWAGRLGDGRALTIGAVQARDGGRQVLQWKGSGPTTYSRGGDGRAVLRSSIREFIASEAMAALGVPTTRALSLIGSDHPVMRETLETAAVVVRVAPNFVRFGTFEYHAATGRTDLLRSLADALIDQDSLLHEPPQTGLPRPPTVYASWLSDVAARTGRLIAHWQALGFCHGVMNTDNMSILGLTLDYGPFGWIDRFNPNHRCNHSDTHGRYSWAMQPAIGAWNCAALAHALSPLLPESDGAAMAIEQFDTAYSTHFVALMRDKLGLVQTHADDADLVAGVFEAMHASGADFTLFFRNLAHLDHQSETLHPLILDTMCEPTAAHAWLNQYRQRLRWEHSLNEPRRTRMNRSNPLYVPRNHLLEQAIRRTQARDPADPLSHHDGSAITQMLEVLRHPYDERPGLASFARQPPAWAAHLQVSCSS
jgi:uncharacterized protein YdiU (UPF0061 family)